MDEDTARDLKLQKDLRWLRKRLRRSLPLTNLDCSITTHEYAPGLERWVTQSDIGLVVQFEDHFLPERSWQDACLLQAKRLYLDSSVGDSYTENSRFKGFDAEQHDRAEELNSSFGYDFVNYLLYCPRPEMLDDLTSAKLEHLRNVALLGNIFDYGSGLELYKHLLKGGSTLDGGLIVSKISPVPTTLSATYAALFGSAIPWSWFLATWLSCPTQGKWLDQRPFYGLGRASANIRSLAIRLARGDSTVINELGNLSDGFDDRPFPVLPAHTIVVLASIGADADEERRQIRSQ